MTKKKKNTHNTGRLQKRESGLNYRLFNPGKPESRPHGISARLTVTEEIKKVNRSTGYAGGCVGIHIGKKRSTKHYPLVKRCTNSR